MTNRQKIRLEALHLLVKAEGNIAELEQNLADFEWEYDGNPVILDKDAIAHILSRFIEGKITAEMVRLWAEALELREDIDYPENQEAVVSEIMHVLANPELEGDLTVDMARQMILR